MTKAVCSKVMWVGRATVFLVGLAVILAVVLGVAATALAAVPGDPFKLGQRNTIDRITQLAGATANSMLRIDNDGTGSALQLLVEPGSAPLTVNSTAGKASNLDADRLDGMEADELSDPRGYAQVGIDGNFDPAHSKGVNDVLIPDGTNNTNLYCFDLTFSPHVAVGSPHLNNSAVIAATTPPNSALGGCPSTHRDAAVRTYGSSEGNGEPINFQIVFI